MKTEMNLPEENEDISVTYRKTFQYYTERREEIMTRRGFYMDGKFRIPPEWRRFGGVLLPHGFGGDHLSPDKIISWEPLKEQ